MLPTLVAAEVRETLLDYLRTTWALSDEELERALFAYLQSDRVQGGTGIFQGPYVRLRLPFEPASPDAYTGIEHPPAYTPYQHQLTAWQRLSTLDGRAPQPTLVVTGTGSGKTEAFLVPILDHCLRMKRRGEKGIKAIILYPMNALAADQARRVAEMVHGDDESSPMRGKLRVGMYVGGEGKHKVMGPGHVIDDRKQLRENPPDVLLTNYKMLDFLLLRPSDRRLWEDNAPDTLRYVVLDELHTYDGAQGTDVACLVRRLAGRLGGARFCPVGTSATVTSERGSSQGRLLEFASDIFGVPFGEDAVVGEKRRSPAAFFSLFGPSSPASLPEDVTPLAPIEDDDIDAHVGRVASAFFPGDERLFVDGVVDRARLGDRIARHPVARELIERGSEAIHTLDELDAALLERADWRARSDADRRALLEGILSMLSWARREAGGRVAPLLQVQVQVWVREVRRLVREVAAEPRFAWRDEQPQAPSGVLQLPMYLCRACGHSGWMSVLSELSRELEGRVNEIGRAALERKAELVYLHRDDAVGDETLPGLGDHVCVRCSKLVTGSTCPRCKGDQTVAVHVHRALSGQTPPRDLQRCPSCNTDGSLGMLASRAASLASVAVGHLYTTPFNEDQKLLAFSDSVQDASHRAGFFSGRTYRFSLRSAMMAAIPSEGDVPLTELPARIWEVWGERRSEADLVAAFMPRDLDYLPEYQAYVEKVRAAHKAGKDAPAAPRALRAKLDRRLQWEVTRELGLAARIGRTLERVGSASVRVSPERFERAVKSLAERLPNRVGAVRDVEPERWRLFVAGLVTRLRLRGGVLDELLRLYFQQDNPKHLSKRFGNELLSPFGRFTSRPIFLTDHQDPKRFDTVQPKQGNWYSDWAQRALAAPLSVRDAREVYAVALPWLVDAGLLVSHRETTRTHWALDPAALRAARDPMELRCDVCSATASMLEGDPAALEDAPCLRYRCTGGLRRTPQEQARVQTYYRRFYERGELGRVWASEHTGLLEREVREAIEEDFKDRHRPDAPNLLSCTPTLEMGIDIGDLSATMLMSVPPSTSSYLQRIGRAGRKTGNALVLTFTTVRPHDLYFFDDPEAAMAGAVDPPGCYLEAPAILRRQALAWCLDAWAKESSQGGLPGRVRDALRGDEAARFPNALFDFLEPRRETLRDSFVAALGTEATREKLAGFFGGKGRAASPIEMSLAELMKRVAEERDDARRLHRRVKDKLDKLEAAGSKVENAEEEREELDREKRFLEKELAALQGQSLIGLLSERGALPNYAFPETGVELRAYVSKDTTRGPAGAERFKWVRAASTAIKELAPFNTFYGMARKVSVDSVDVGSGRAGRSGENIEAWQLCAECGHMAPAGTESPESCPRCQTPGFREQGRRRELVRMERVSAFARQRDAAFSDESEDRERAFYETQVFFDPEPGTARHAHLDERTPFGFELLPDLTLRELNFGRRRSVPGSSRLGGREVPDLAFAVCAECGQVHDPGDTGPRTPKHRRWCSARDKAEEKQPWRLVHLYREVTSEALRLFLPVAMLDPGVKLPNARAAIELGMRHFFGGDPDHLRVAIYDEPSKDDPTSRRRFVVIHDTVPGGTGVLAELAANRGEKLRRVLELAKTSLEGCACAEREAPACYACLYAYRHQRELGVLDREVALDLVTKLLGAFEHLESVPTIGVLDTASILESELEHRFLAALSSWAAREDGASMQQVSADSWQLEVAGKRWTLRAQVTLDPGDDVAVVTRPDFVLYPDGFEARAVVVYCDGAAYHVKPGKARGRIADDFRKREAVVRSGRFAVCSLAWGDVDVFLAKPDDVPPWLPHDAWVRTGAQLATSLGLGATYETAMHADPMRWLVHYLTEPDEGRWRDAALLSLMQPLSAQSASAESVEALAAQLRDRDEMPRLVAALEPGETAFVATRVSQDPVGGLVAFAPRAALAGIREQPKALIAVLRLDDTQARRAVEGFGASWRAFLRAHMALQWLPGLVTVTSEQLLAPPAVLYDVPSLASAPTPKAAETMEQGMLTVAALEVLGQVTDEDAKVLVRAALEAGAPIPMVPYEEGEGERGIDVTVEVGWPDARVALYLPGDEDSVAKLEAAGWTCWSADEADAAQLIRALKGEA